MKNPQDTKVLTGAKNEEYLTNLREKYNINTDYQYSEQEKQYLTWWGKRMKRIDTFRQDRVKQWEDNEMRVYDRIIAPVKDSYADSTEAIRQPFEFAISEAKLSFLIQKPPTCYIRGVESSDQIYEDTLTHALDYKMRQANWGLTLPVAMAKAVNNGESFVKVSWKKTYKDILLPNSTEKKTYNVYNGLCYEIIDNKNVFIDETAEQIYTPHGSGSSKFTTIRVPKIDYETFREFVSKNNNFKNVNAVIPQSYDDTRFYVYRNDEEKNISSGEFVTLFETWDELRDKYVITANGIIIYESDYEISRVPLAMFKNIPIPNRLYSKGDPEILRGLTGISNSLFNKAEQQVELSVNPTIVLGHGIDVNQIETGAGGIIEANTGDVRKSVQTIQYPDMTNGIQYMLDYIKNAITYTSGVNLDVLSQPRSQTAFGLAMQQEQTLQRLGLFVRYNEMHAIKDIYEISLELLQKNLPKEEAKLINDSNGNFTIQMKFPKIKVKNKRVKRTENSKGVEYYKFIDSSDPYSTFEADKRMISASKFDVEIVPGSMRDDMLMVKTEKLTRIIQTLAQNPTWLARFSDKVPDFFVEAIGESPDKLLKPLVLEQDNKTAPALSSLEKEYQLLVEGKLKVIDIVDNNGEPEEHLRYLRQKLTENKDKLTPKAKNNIYEAIKYYNDLKSNKMNEKESNPQQEQQMQPMMGNINMPKSMQPSGTAETSIRKEVQQRSRGLNPMNG